MRKNMKKVVSCVLLGGFSFALLLSSNFSNASNRKETASILNVRKSSSLVDETTCVEAPSDLKVNVISGTKTDYSFSFTATFTTGGKAFSPYGSPYNIAPEDSSYDDFYNQYVAKFSELSKEEKDELEEKYKNGESSFKGFVDKINKVTKATTITLPNSLSYQDILEIVPTYINVGAIENFSNIKGIIIPKNIIHIYNESFKGFENADPDFKFYVELSESKANESYEEDWNHGLAVEYSYDYEGKTKSGDKKPKASGGGNTTYGNADINFILGYGKGTSDYKPLLAQYNVYSKKEADGSFSNENLIGTRQTAFVQKGVKYDSVGKMISSYSTTLNVDIYLENKSEEIDPSSIKILNIFKAKQNEEGFVPDTSSTLKYSRPNILFSDILNFSDFLNIKFVSANSFAGYTSLLVNYKIANLDIYKDIKKNVYKTYADRIAKKDLYIRYRVNSLAQSNYIVNYDGENISKKIISPVSQFVVDGNSYQRAFIIKNSDYAPNFDFRKIKSLNIEGMYVTLDLYGENGPVAKSSISTRFGIVNIMQDSRSNSAFHDYNLILILIAAIYTVLFIAGDVLLYFYLSKKYRNDEFRRMKPRKFVVSSIITYICSMIVLFSLTFISMRLSVFKNSVVVFNPTDPFVIVFTIFAVVVIGYFIKTMVEMSKTSKTRKQNIKLKINEDTVDDGTH